MRHAVMLVYRREADMTDPHPFGADRAIMRISLRHDLLQLVVILPRHDACRRGRDKIRGIERRDLIHIQVAGEGTSEGALISLE
jgi:hypothetical protein